MTDNIPNIQVLEEREEKFIEYLVWEGMLPQEAAAEAGYAANYGYALKKRLAKHIVAETEHYLALHAPKAARKMVDSIDNEMPNPVNLSAAKEVLDRVGVTRKDHIETTTIKANIFILPEKKPTIIDHEE